MYAQYAHAVPSHTPYMDDKNFITALREKDKEKEKEKVKEKEKEKDREKEKEDRGRGDNIYEEARGLYDVSAQNDAREVLVPSLSFLFLHFPAHCPLFVSYCIILTSTVFVTLILLVRLIKTLCKMYLSLSSCKVPPSSSTSPLHPSYSSSHKNIYSLCIPLIYSPPPIASTSARVHSLFRGNEHQFK